MAKPFRPEQKFSKLKRQHVEAGSLFIDPLFPPNESSLFLRKNPTSLKIEWKRPRVSNRFENGL